MRNPSHRGSNASGYIDHLAEVGEDTLLVSVADKLDNARSMLRDYHEHGPSLWQRFNRKNPHDHLWYYGGLLKAYRAAAAAAGWSRSWTGWSKS